MCVWCSCKCSSKNSFECIIILIRNAQSQFDEYRYFRRSLMQSLLQVKSRKKGKSTKSLIDHIHLKQFASYSKAQILEWQRQQMYEKIQKKKNGDTRELQAAEELKNLKISQILIIMHFPALIFLSKSQVIQTMTSSAFDQ